MTTETHHDQPFLPPPPAAATTTPPAPSATPPPTPVRSVATRIAELRGLTRAAGLTSTVPSPLAGAEHHEDDPSTVSDPGPETRRALAEAGWLGGEEHPAPTPVGLAVLERLTTPRRRIDLVIGAETWWYRWTGLGAGGADDPLLAWSGTPDPERVLLSFPHRPGWPTDLLGDHLRSGPIGPPVPFEHELSDRAYAVWLALLDRDLERLLRSALDRTPTLDDLVSPTEVERLLAEGRTGGHLSWQVTINAALWPEIDLRPDTAAIAAGLAELIDTGILVQRADGAHRWGGAAAELVQRLVPVARWASVTIASQDPEHRLLTARFAIRRGHGVVLIEHRRAEGDGVHLRSIGDEDLELVLLRLAQGDALVGG